MYKHTSPSNKSYIGITSKNPEERWGHNGIQYRKQPFYRAIKKYGWDNFTHEILYSNLTEKEAKDKEKELIRKYKTKNNKYGYNCTYGGDGTLGLKRTKESIESFKSQISKEVYQYLPDGSFVKKWTSIKSVEEETGFCASWISACCLGKTKQAHGYLWRHDYIEKLNPVRLGHEGKEVYQYSLDGNFIQKWDSLMQIQNKKGYASSNIALCCKGKQNTAYGYIWKFDKSDKVEPIEKITYNQYDFDGNYIKTFYSIKDINESLGYKNLPIADVCNGIRKQTGGYMWSYEKKDKIEPYKKRKGKFHKPKKILQYSTDGMLIAEFDSLTLAGKSIRAKNLSVISDCANGKRSNAYGYIWKYKEDIYEELITENGGCIA